MTHLELTTLEKNLNVDGFLPHHSTLCLIREVRRFMWDRERKDQSIQKILDLVIDL